MSVAGYTLEELVQEGLDFQFSEIEYEALFKRWLNQAQRRMVIESEIRTQEETFGISTTTATATYELPSNYARLIDFSNTQITGLLEQVDPKEWDQLGQPSSGRPRLYAVLGKNLSLYPTPDTGYPLMLRYWRLPTDMLQPSDTPEVPAQYQELLLAWALKKAYKRENDSAMAQMWEVEWEKGILKMRGEVQSDSFDGPRQVGGTWGGDPGLITYGWR
jgi:hypothetical protein